MKICITSPIFPPDLGGPSIYVPSLARYLVSRGHEVKVIAFCEEQEHEGYPFKSFLAVLRHARDADLIYINEHLALHVALAGRILGKPMVIRMCVDGTWEISHRLGWHQDGITEYVYREYGFKVRFIRGLQRMWWAWVRYIIAPSRFLRGIALHYGVPPQKVRLIHNAYHGPETFPVNREEARRALGIPEGERMILTICRLMIWKGVDGIIRALSDLPEACRLHVVGDGDERDRWQTLARDLGLEERVVFHGNVAYDRIPLFLKAADVFVLNSNYEGLSHTLLEVMWAGLPPVVTGVCGNPELVEDGVNGFTIPFNRPDLIRDRVLRILEDPALSDRFRERGLEKVKGFARGKIFEDTEDLFLEAVGKR